MSLVSTNVYIDSDSDFDETCCRKPVLPPKKRKTEAVPVHIPVEGSDTSVETLPAFQTRVASDLHRIRHTKSCFREYLATANKYCKKGRNHYLLYTDDNPHILDQLCHSLRSDHFSSKQTVYILSRVAPSSHVV